MNGKNHRWLEQRWNDRQEGRLQRMEEKRLKRQKLAAMAAAEKGEKYVPTDNR